jgi:hypothetical protein
MRHVVHFAKAHYSGSAAGVFWQAQLHARHAALDSFQLQMVTFCSFLISFSIKGKNLLRDKGLPQAGER